MKGVNNGKLIFIFINYESSTNNVIDINFYLWLDTWFTNRRAYEVAKYTKFLRSLQPKVEQLQENLKTT